MEKRFSVCIGNVFVYKEKSQRTLKINNCQQFFFLEILKTVSANNICKFNFVGKDSCGVYILFFQMWDETEQDNEGKTMPKSEEELQQPS